MHVELSEAEVEVLLAYIDLAVRSQGIAQAENALILTRKLKAALENREP